MVGGRGHLQGLAAPLVERRLRKLFDPLYFEYSRGRDEFEYIMSRTNRRESIPTSTRGASPWSASAHIVPTSTPVVRQSSTCSGSCWGKNSLEIHPSLHREVPVTTVETNDFKLAIEEETGQNLYWFFDQWFYKAGHPKFKVSYKWNDSAKASAFRFNRRKHGQSHRYLPHARPCRI